MTLPEEKRRSLAKHPRYAKFFRDGGDLPGASAGSRVSLECIHFGEPVRGDAAPDRTRDWHKCNAGHGVVCKCNCNAAKCKDYIADAAENTDVAASTSPDSIQWPLRFDVNNIAPHVRDRRFNSSLLAWQGGYLFAWRDRLAGSNIWVHRLDSNFKPVGSAVKLILRHEDCANGREDPRLFLHDEKPHVMITGVIAKPIHTNVLYARLNPQSLQVEALFSPRYSGRNLWEKNWCFFSHDGDLFAVYTIAPHKVLRIDGNDVTEVIQTDNFAYWTGGEMRGGASPLRVGDEYWSFFHANKIINGMHTYHTGLYTFEAKYPFRPRRIISDPILWPDPKTRVDDPNTANVIFAGSAVILGDSFIVPHGVYDRWTECHKFEKADLEAKLVPISPPDDFAYREGCNDPKIWQAISGGYDEYKLKRLDLRGATVIDIGAHIGIAAREFLSRGTSVIHCYEPDPRNVDLLRKNLAKYDGVRIFDKPVWSHKTAMALDVREDPSHNQIGVNCDGPILAEAIEDVILRAKAEQPHNDALFVLKIDCEDSEGAIIPAAEHLLHLFDVVVGEWHSYFSLSACRSALLAAGFAFETSDPKAPGGIFFAQKPRGGSVAKIA